MSAARHHAEWTSLLDVSGPFVSIPVLDRVFPQGIDDLPSELRDLLHLAHEEWLDVAASPRFDIALHNAWIRIVFRDLLGYEDRDILQDSPLLRFAVPEQRETVEATFAIKNPADREEGGKPRLLVMVVEPSQSVDKPLARAIWKAAPVDRMMMLLRGSQANGSKCRVGLVTNGANWVMVHVAPNESTSYVGWSSELWFDEPLTLRAMATLLSARRFFGVPDDETLEALIEQSSKDAQEVTDRLGAQVRRATEVLVQSIDRIDRGRQGKLLEGITSVTLYESCVTVMMRLIFLLSAEERKLLLLDAETYERFYAVSTLHDQLQETADRHGEEVLERRYDAWSRLLATFRAVFGGIEHIDLRLPAYGGSLFNPDRFPFLEGRLPGTSWRELKQQSVAPLAIDNRTVLHLLRSITRLEVKAGGGRTETRRLSFRALDVEQIGHVYEGLLDHTARRAEDVTLSLDGKLEPEISVKELELQQKKDPKDLVKWLVDQTGRTASAIQNALNYNIDQNQERTLLMACENHQPVYQRVRPWAGLVRNDTHGQPVVIAPGAVYVTEGTDRRSTGTHYTPRALTEPIAQYTLEPLVYEGPAEGLPKECWKLKSAREILALRVCDLAMGSGAFLVETCRYLALRLVEAWEAEEKLRGKRLILAPDGGLSMGDMREQIVPLDENERLVIARRYVADRCLYGVDKNPWAVEMGKLSLWLTTMQKGRPFSFVDHALGVGDSLLGVTSLDQLLYFHLDPVKGKKLHAGLFSITKPMEAALKRSVESREKLEDFATNDINDSRRKEWLLQQANEATEDLRAVADLLIGAALSASKEAAFESLLVHLGDQLSVFLSEKNPEKRQALRGKLKAEASRLMNEQRQMQHAERRPFHWAIEFPEVMQHGGFDAFVGNPPFMGGQKLTGNLGTDYRDYLVQYLAEGRRGSADLCAYFYLRAASLLKNSGGFGLIATNTIAQGDTREVGLDALVKQGMSVPRAVPSRKWPGEAALEVSHVWLRKSEWKGEFALDDKVVLGIGSQLSVPGQVKGTPYELAANDGKSFQGSNVVGLGFTMNPEEARSLIDLEPKYKDVIFPYLNGQDLNTDPEQCARRWVINFFDWPLDRDSAPISYIGPVAADYEKCLDIVRKLVKPERDKNNRDVYRKYWWHYAEKRPALYAAIAGMEWVLVRARIANRHSVVKVPTNIVLNEKTVVFLNVPFAVLQGSIHEEWARLHSSTLRQDLQYTPSDCFDTFPFPKEGTSEWNALENIGARYDEHRRKVMIARQEGLTKTYNRFHEPDEKDPSIQKLRELHVEMDEAVKLAYGWKDLSLDHGFHTTKQGIRYTISEAARLEVLDRLLTLNHKRYAEEVKAGLHGDTKKKPAKAKVEKAPVSQRSAAPSKRMSVSKDQLGLLVDKKD